MNKNRKKVTYKASFYYKILAFMLSVVLFMSNLPFGAIMYIFAETREPSFVFVDKNGNKISGIVVTLIGTDGEEMIVSEPSNDDGVAMFVADTPLVGSSYTYTIDTGLYAPVEDDTSFTIEEDNPPVEIVLYAPAPTGEITSNEQTASFGGTVTLQVYAEGMGELSYQWYKDDVLLDGETSTTLTINSALITDAGTYSCEVVSQLSDNDVKLVCTSTLNVLEDTPTIAVSAVPETGTLYTDEGVQLSAIVSHSSNDTVVKPTGEVEFFVDDISKGTALLNDGIASLSSVILTSNAPHHIYAKYLGENDMNYTDAASEPILYEVGKISPMEGEHYTRNTPNGNDGWYKMESALEIAPIGLFDQIREGEDGEWKSILIKEEETSELGSDVIFYLSNSVTGEISNPQIVHYKLDKTPPDKRNAMPIWVDDEYGQKEWECEYRGDIDSNEQWKTDKFLYHMTLTATDVLSGLEYFQWKYRNVDEWSEQLPATSENIQINVNYNQWYAGNGIDIRVCDKAGNVSDDLAIPAQNSLVVEYDKTNFQRYVDHDNNDVLEDDFDGNTRLIYNQETIVTLTATADIFKSDAIMVYVNDKPVAIEWKLKETNYVGTMKLLEGDSKINILADGYSILSNETGSKIVYEKYISNTHTVDTQIPIIDVKFDKEADILTSDRTMTVSILDRNFRADELYFSNLTAKDIQENDISQFNATDFLNTLKSASWEPIADNVHQATITFSIEANYNLTLEYKDLANNPADSYHVSSFAIDKTAPDNLQISYISNPISTILQVITFGYYKPSVTIQLRADDSTTGIDHFNWTYTQEEGTSTTHNVAAKSGQIDCTDSEHFSYINNNKTAVATFTLTADEFAQYRGRISFTATDKAGQTSAVHYGDGTAKDEQGNLYDTSSNHVVVVDTIAPTREVTYLEPQQIRTKDTLEVFTGDKATYVNQENINSIIYYDNTYGDIVPVTLKIVEANFYAQDVVVKVNNVPYNVDDWKQNNSNSDEWIGTVKLIDDGDYVITVDYTDRSGNIMPFYQSEKVVIDRVKPVIDKYKFIPITSEGDAQTTTFIEVLEYGYYFKTDFKVEIHTSDALPSSGFDRLVYRMIPYKDGVKQGEITGTLPVIDGIANLTVPAEFKGQIFAESYDNVGNKSAEVTPQAFVVDKIAPTIDVVNNDLTTYHDAVGNSLYVTDMSITVTITDVVSGIKEIGYAQNSENMPMDRRSIILDNVGYQVGDNLDDGWIVSAMDVNLVTKVTKTFFYNSDDNDIILTFDATDRSGNKLENVSSDMFTVDKTAPVINVVFRADDGADMYYNANRIADIIVIERNFDESLIQATIENTFGNVPSFAFTEVSNTQHTAVIDFDEGDYTFEISGMDLGNHTATVNYSGGNEQLFYVDKTNPVVEDNFVEFNNTATENSFNQDKTVSISITEHNFDSTLTQLRIFTKAAGSDHNMDNLTDVTTQFIGGANWVTNGDIHTITFTISTDAVYQIEMTPADLAGNVSDYRSTVVFEIDKTVPIVHAKNDRFVGNDAVEFVDVYTPDRKDEPAPTIEFSDSNIDHIKYDLTVWIPDYTNSEALPMIKPEKIYLNEDITQSGIIKGEKFTLPSFTKDGVYTVQLIAVDIAGNESIPNVNTYARLIEQDVLAFILNSNVKNKTGLYSFQYENGKPISMRPDKFSDLNILVFAKKDTNVDIVLRDTNGEEVYTNAQASTDESIYGFIMYDFLLKSDFFKDNFSNDVDVDLSLRAKNNDESVGLGDIHIDNTAPTCELPKEFDSWQWYFGEETRTITVSKINELLDKNSCKVYDNGKEIDFIYVDEEGTLSFNLEKGWHTVGIVLKDMAGNENNIQEKANIHVGYFWLWFFILIVCLIICVIVFVFLYNRKKKRMLDDE